MFDVLTMSLDQPFGDTDATAMSDVEILRRFDGFDGDERYGGLAVTDADTRTCLILGGRGSGRSTYLGRAHATARLTGSAFVLPMDNHNPPDSASIRFLCEAFLQSDAVKDWQLLWRAAILRSVASHVLYNTDLGRPIEDDPSAFGFVEDFEEVLQSASRPGGYCPAPVGVYSQVVSIAETFRVRGSAELASYLRLDMWEMLENRLAGVLRPYKPLGLFLDSLDREFRHAPFHWLTCEKGLFYQVLHFSENQLLSERLRIVATVRDLVYSMVREGDSATKYPAAGRIRHLYWTPDAARRFLRDKIQALGESRLMMRPDITDDERAVEAWLGIATIENRRLGRVEAIEDYLVSHTFYAPRDVVALGNELARCVRRARALRDQGVDPLEIRRAVEKLAFDMAQGRLSTAAAELAALPEGVGLRGVFAELKAEEGARFEAVAAFQAQLSGRLERILRRIGQVRFSRAQFDAALEVVAPELHGSDVLSALWRNELVGYIGTTDAGATPLFYSSGTWDRLTMPSNAESLVAHRCLIDLAELDPDPALGATSNA